MKLLKELRDVNVFGKDIKFGGKYKIRKAARAVVFDRENKIAIMNSRYYNFHKLPGGGIEDGEDVLLALDREIKEEVGADIEMGEEVGKIVEYRNEYRLKQTSYCYIAKVIGDLRKQKLTKDELKNHNFELKWVSTKKAIKLLENDKPKDYTGKFIVVRDLIFLKEAKKYGFPVVSVGNRKDYIKEIKRLIG